MPEAVENPEAQEEGVRTVPRFDLEVSDLGPIIHADISLRPLTVFIGPNGSGKSWLATMVSAALRAGELSQRGYYPGGAFGEGPSRADTWPDVPEALEGEWPDSDASHEAVAHGRQTAVPPEYVNRCRRWWLTTRWVPTMLEEGERLLGAAAGALARRGTPRSGLACQTQCFAVRFGMDEDGTVIGDVGLPPWQVLLQPVTGRPPVPVEWQLGPGGALVRLASQRLVGLPPGWPPPELRSVVFDVCVSGLFVGYPRQPPHLPASRSGLMVVRPELMGAVASAAAEPSHTPAYPGVVADLLSRLVRPFKEDGPFAELARWFEEELTGGGHVTMRLSPAGFPDYRFEIGGTEMPLHMASATVTESAPLVLYLRHLIQPGHLLIIEEPEAHLHPANQALLARLFAKLVRAGVNLLITTHSDFLLEQLSNLILISQVDAGQRREAYNSDTEEYLHASEVGVYVFEPAKDDSPAPGFVTQQVEVTDDDGIAQDEFLKVFEALHYEQVALERELAFGGAGDEGLESR